MKKVGDYKNPEYDLVNDPESSAIGGNDNIEKDEDITVEKESLGLRNDEDKRLEDEISRRKDKAGDGTVEKESLGLRNDEERRLEDEIDRRKNKIEKGEAGELGSVEEKIKRLNSLIEERKFEEQRLKELKSTLFNKTAEIKKSQGFFKIVLRSTPDLGIAREELENLESQIKISNEYCKKLLTDETKLREDLGGEYAVEIDNDMEKESEKLSEKQASELWKKLMLQVHPHFFHNENVNDKSGNWQEKAKNITTELQEIYKNKEISWDDKLDKFKQLEMVIAERDSALDIDNNAELDKFLTKFRSGSDKFMHQREDLLKEYPELKGAIDIDEKIDGISSTPESKKLLTGDRGMALLALRSARKSFGKFYLENWMKLLNFKAGSVDKILDMDAEEYISNNEQDNVVKIFKKLKSTISKQDLELSGIEPISGESVAKWSKRLVNFILKSK